jgi:hypothetical protein
MSWRYDVELFAFFSSHRIFSFNMADAGLKVLSDGLSALESSGQDIMDGSVYSGAITLLVAMSVAFLLGAVFAPWLHGSGVDQVGDDKAAPRLRYV